MLKAKSLSTFRTKLRADDDATTLVNPGDIIKGDDEHLRALARNRLVQILDDDPDEYPQTPVAPATSAAIIEDGGPLPEEQSIQESDAATTRTKTKAYR